MDFPTVHSAEKLHAESKSGFAHGDHIFRKFHLVGVFTKDLKFVVRMFCLQEENKCEPFVMKR